MSHSDAGPPSRRTRAVESKLRSFALGYPETREDLPWGHRAIKVRGKTFVFLGADANGLFATVKLPDSNAEALDEPFTEVTGYGLGKSGWVTARFEDGDDFPVDLLLEWIDESFRAIAPRKVLAELDGEPPPAPRKAKATKQSPAKKGPTRKSKR